MMNVVSDLDVTFVSEISAWLYSFITYIETEDEAKDSMTKLMGVIRAAGEEGVVTSHVVEDTIEYVETKFIDELPNMGNWRYMTKLSGWVGENCFTEGSNGSLAKCIFGPKPKHPLHQAGDCIITHTEEVFRKVGTEAHKLLQKTRQKRRTTEDESDDNDAQRQLSTDILGVKNNSAFAEYRLSLNYKCGKVVFSDGVFNAPPQLSQVCGEVRQGSTD